MFLRTLLAFAVNAYLDLNNSIGSFFETHKIVRAFPCYAANEVPRLIGYFDVKLFGRKVN